MPSANGAGNVNLRPDIWSELRDALRHVAVRFDQLPPDVRDRLDLERDPLEDEVNEAIRVDDGPRALGAIQRWRRHWLQEFREAKRMKLGAPTSRVGGGDG